MDNNINDEFANELAKRLFSFAADTIKFPGSLENSTQAKTIKYQLAKSSGSSGANYEEAQAGSSKADFANRIRISLREMRESNYWLRLLKASNKSERDRLIIESGKLILGSIAQKVR